MTMKTPEMEVVRFSESDVIVASGFPTKFGSVRNAGGVKGDLIVTINGNQYDYNTLNTGIGDHIISIGDVTFTNGGSKTVKDLLADDVNNSSFDGEYESYDDGYNYIWKRQ